MNAPRNIRPAAKPQLPQIMKVLSEAKKIMRSDGNMNQWTGGYPSEEIVLSDISRGYGFVVEDGGKVVGYFACIPSPEPTYAKIYEGRWLEDGLPYHVVHRIGSLPDVHGVFKSIMDWCFEKDPNIRIDTHRDNKIMRHNILKEGFTYCGIIYLESGDERLAYQKILRQ
ncbi:MAG: N-acetyltransferase [Bacteroidales bacterium]|nr:N-acetyltransferase [Bacteroidales bacterium]